ncbi:hypothetical protein [Streptomyces marianii]|uniref:Uncharacterized protein n=1 Tax=Streptomyces marianii TaxID=1817406 RepID=A0A5R9E6E8_9ACTN|nr:hypothetical protein [Streptomyces marianii]TLQ44625.1 hypothetical protein FEF34_17290 [Streptomyces marianii]
MLKLYWYSFTLVAGPLGVKTNCPAVPKAAVLQVLPSSPGGGKAADETPGLFGAEWSTVNWQSAVVYGGPHAEVAPSASF